MTRMSSFLSLIATLAAVITVEAAGGRPKSEPDVRTAEMIPARLVQRVARFYPDRAILNGLAGVVLLEVPIDLDP